MLFCACCGAPTDEDPIIHDIECVWAEPFLHPCTSNRDKNDLWLKNLKLKVSKLKLYMKQDEIFKVGMKLSRGTLNPVEFRKIIDDESKI